MTEVARSVPTPELASRAITTFGLVPGAWHGAWAFDRLIPEIRARGHEAIAVDLPCDDPTAGFEAYTDAALAALDAVPGGELVLVAHSLGAHTAVRVAIARSVRAVVFVCGVIPPRAGERGPEPPMDDPGTFDGLELDDLGRMWWPDPIDAVAAMYADCDPEDAAWAVARLRPQSRTPHERLAEVLAWPDVAMVSVVCSADHVVRAEWGRWAAGERLGGVPVVELPGGALAVPLPPRRAWRRARSRLTARRGSSASIGSSPDEEKRCDQDGVHGRAGVRRDRRRPDRGRRGDRGRADRRGRPWARRR